MSAGLPREWGCPKCGHKESWVKDTARDEDGHFVRLRACTRCREKWATEELALADAASYWTRAYSRNQARLRLEHEKRRNCTICGSSYKAGSYREHVDRSVRHETALMQSAKERVKYHRKYTRKAAKQRRKAA